MSADESMNPKLGRICYAEKFKLGKVTYKYDKSQRVKTHLRMNRINKRLSLVKYDPSSKLFTAAARAGKWRWLGWHISFSTLYISN